MVYQDREDLIIRDRRFTISQIRLMEQRQKNTERKKDIKRYNRQHIGQAASRI